MNAVGRRPKPTPSVLKGGLSKDAVAGMKATVEKAKANGGGKALFGGSNGKAGTITGRASSDKPNSEKVRKPKPKLVRPKEFRITVKVYQGAERMTVEEAKKLIGWTIVGASQKGQKGTGEGYTGKFHLRDMEGNKILLANNSTNRPFRPGLCKRYMSDMLRRKWELNAESIVFDWTGKCQSGQHRLCGFILAEQARVLGAKPAVDSSKPNPLAWTKRYWKGPVVIDALVASGISDERKVIDTLDQGQKRTLGDVFYQAEIFGDGEPGSEKVGQLQVVASDAVRRKLANILGGAVRLVWLRAGGKSISDAPHFPVSEAMEFFYNHEKIKNAVLHIYNLDGGPGMDGSKISGYLTMAYAAALYYLMSVSGSDGDAWKELSRDGRGSEALDFSNEWMAKLFWEKFASGAMLEQTDPIHVVRGMLRSMTASGSSDRDEIVGLVIKAFNAWADGLDSKKKDKPTTAKVKAKDLQMRRKENDLGVMKLTEEPRLGGIDIEGPPKEEQSNDWIDDVPEDSPAAKSGKGRGTSLGEAEKKAQAFAKHRKDLRTGKDTRAAGMAPKYEASKDEREGSKAGKKWAEGDTAWVKAEGGDHYFGTIEAFYKGEDVPDSVDVRDDQDKLWNEDVSRLSVTYPA